MADTQRRETKNSGDSTQNKRNHHLWLSATDTDGEWGLVGLHSNQKAAKNNPNVQIRKLTE